MVTNKEIVEDEGIVIDISKYSESSALLMVLTSDGLKSFYLNGVYKLKSNLKSCLLIGNIIKFETHKAESKIKSIINSKVVFDISYCYFDYKKAMLISYIVYMLKYTKMENDKLFIGEFEFYKMIISAISNHNLNNIMLCFLAKLIEYSGYKPHLDSCYICNRKDNIVYFDINNGFMCKDCFNKNDIDYNPFSKNDLYVIKYAFSNINEDRLDALTPKDSLIKMIMLFDDFITLTFDFKKYEQLSSLLYK